MTNDRATRRYLVTLIPTAIVLIAVCMALRLAEDAGWLATPVQYAVSIVPVALMLGMFWVHWRYMNEIDEFLRSIQMKGAFTGLTIVMTVATGWGWLEFFADAPPLSIFWLNPIYWIAYATAAWVYTPRDGKSS